jgi:hypothetical protein
MKKLFKVSLPQTLFFEDLDQAVWFAKLLADAKTLDSTHVYSDNARDWRWHTINYTKGIDLNINFSSESFYENKWEALEKVALYTASPEEIEKRQAMDDVERKTYMKQITETVPAMSDTDEIGF